MSNAIAAYRRALEIEGNKPEIMVALAKAYLRTERYIAAKELLLSAIELDARNNIAWQYLGFAHLKLHEVDDAIASYEEVVRVNREDWMGHKALGVAFMLKALKDRDNYDSLKTKALEQWNLSLEIKSDQPKLMKFVERYSR